jgi:hypothetical protein
MKHINIKTQIKTSIKIACTVLLVSMMHSCNVKEVLTDANGQNKSLVLFNPNFLLTNYQVRIVDSANNFLNKEMIVEVYSNKKIVNDEGYIKNSFKVTNGILNFSVDPNEVISVADPIKLYFFITPSNSDDVESKIFKFEGKTKFDRIFIVNLDNSPIIKIENSIISNSTNSSVKINTATDELSQELFKFNGIEIPIYKRKNVVVKTAAISNDESVWKTHNIINTEDHIVSKISRPSSIFNIKSTNDVQLKLGYRNIVDLNSFSYAINIYGKGLFNEIFYYDIYKDGSSKYFSVDPITGKTSDITNNPITNWSGIISFSKGVTIKTINISSTRVNTELKDCPTGFNFNFNVTDIAKGAAPEIAYIAYRNDSISKKDFISNIGVAKVNEQNPIYNTGELLYSNKKNKVVFQENSQYLVTPSTIELTGPNACGSSSNIKIIPKPNTEFYKLAVKIQCEKDNFGVVANANVLFRKKGTRNWEGLTIKNGIANVYLEKNAVYEVTGSSGKYNFEFNFTNDPSSFVAQKNESLSKNKDLKDMTFKLSNDASGNKILNMDILFYQTACPVQ